MMPAETVEGHRTSLAGAPSRLHITNRRVQHLDPQRPQIHGVIMNLAIVPRVDPRRPEQFQSARTFHMSRQNTKQTNRRAKSRMKA